MTMANAPNRPDGAIRPHGVWNNDLADLVVPPLFAPGHGLVPDIPRVLHIDPAEIGGYVSVAWLVVAVWAVVRHRRSARHGGLVRVLAVTVVLMWLLSMGSPLRVFGAEVPTPGPFRVIEHIPVLMNILPMRLAVHVVLCLSALTAVLLHHALRDAHRRRAAGERIRGAASLGPFAAVLLTCVLIAPVAVPTRDITVPRFFTSDAVTDTIPAGAVVKALPTPRAVAEADYAQSMVWQAVTGMHYRETGGYFIGGTDSHAVTSQALLDPLDQLLRDEEQTAVRDFDEGRTAEAVRGIRAGGTDFVLIPVDPPLLHWPADELAGLLAQSAGCTSGTRRRRLGRRPPGDRRRVVGLSP